MMHYLIADAATQPYIPPGTPAWAIGVIAIIVALGGFVATLVFLMPWVSKLIEQVKGIATVAAVKAEAAQTTATQAAGHAVSLDRQMTTLALNTPAPAQRPATSTGGHFVTGMTTEPAAPYDPSTLRSQP